MTEPETYERDELEIEGEESWLDCGMGPDGCDQAGTEYCDWDCPYSG